MENIIDIINEFIKEIRANIGDGKFFENINVKYYENSINVECIINSKDNKKMDLTICEMCDGEYKISFIYGNDNYGINENEIHDVDYVIEFIEQIKKIIMKTIDVFNRILNAFYKK